MKHINNYHVFEKIGILTSEQEAWLNRSTIGTTWDINEEGLVDVNGSFFCCGHDLKDFKGVKFGHIKETFNCSSNRIESLDGAPITVNGAFVCDKNRLTSLKGAPVKVGESFWCENNQIVSLEGLPKYIGGNFWASNNPITEETLETVAKEMLKPHRLYTYTEAFLECLSQIPDPDFKLMLLALSEDISDPRLVERVIKYISKNPIKKIGLVSEIKKRMPNLYSKISEVLSSDAELMSDLGELGF